MKNKKISTILGIIILLVISVGAYLYTNNKSQIELLPEIQPNQQIENNEPQSGLIETQKDSKQNEISNSEYIRGFSFSVNDPSIVHPFTRALAEKKNRISEKEIIDDSGELFYVDDNQIIIKFEQGYPCCIERKDYLYVYTNSNSDLITGIYIDEEYSQKKEITPNFLIQLVPKYLDKIEPTVSIPQSLPENEVVDGYYYASIDGWNSEKKEAEIDFLTFNSEQRPFDILMSKLSGSSSLTSNLELENNNIRSRNFSISRELSSKILFDGKASNGLDTTIIGSVGGYVDIWLGNYYLVLIENETIVEIKPIVNAS